MANVGRGEDGGIPLLRLRGVSKVYASGENEVRALDGVTLDIRKGEFVAIMGQSGSGKSTLMNVMGCLDTPTEGEYLVGGRSVAGLGADALATLRRTTFGFIFQRYNLLATANAEENVEIPAIYAGMPRPDRLERAQTLLRRLGMGDRGGHRPGQLSGGQQQRVAIARALMNDPPIVLADEPTGALDSKSGAEVMALLKELHAEGRTIILITHDASVAAHAERVVRIQDGKVQKSETRNQKPDITKQPSESKTEALETRIRKSGELVQVKGEDTAVFPEMAEATKMAMRALRVNLFRTMLTLLGIIIGVASVITMLAAGEGSKRNMVSQISAMGTNLLTIRPGAPGIRPTGEIATLVMDDAKAIAELDNVEALVPERSGRYTLRVGETDYASTVQGTGADFPTVRDWNVERGIFFSQEDMASYAPVAVLGQTVAKSLFPDGDDPVGQYIQVRNVPFQVIGVMATKGASMGGNDMDDVVLIPVTTGMVRLFGRTHLSGITIKVTDVTRIDATQEEIRQLLMGRHRTEDFSVRNMASILDMATSINATLTMLLGTVAAISLLVGGIGVMNIMLVSVTERTREIGIRMATGARRMDIMLQFITEAALVCTLGGLLGIALGVGIGLALMLVGVHIAFTPGPALLAFGCAFATGLIFGFLPARRASRLDPVVALASE